MMKILVADDHCLFLEGLKYMLHGLYPEVDITGVINGNDAFDALNADIEYDLVILDLKLPNRDGFDLLKSLLERNFLTPILILSSSDDPEDIDLALTLGASGFVSKSFKPDEMKIALDTIFSGNIYVPNYGTHGAVATDAKNTWASQHNITPRQLEVLRLVKRGYSNNEISEKIFVTQRTIKAHLEVLFKNMHVKSRTELVQKANQLGLD